MSKNLNIHNSKDERKVLIAGCLTEFGERYGYYIFQSLLITYLMHHFHLAEKISESLVGTILALTYISAVVAGYIADKVLGYYRAAFLGSILMIIGNFLLATIYDIYSLYFALSLISLATGLIKSNVSSFIGSFYDKSKLSEGHRDFGFNIFYVGINIGGFAGLLLSSYLANNYGYTVAFMSSIVANIIMIINLIFFYFKLHIYIDKSKLRKRNLLKVIIICIAYVLASYLILKNPIIANFALVAAAVICIFILVSSAMQSKMYARVFCAFIFFLLSVVYWAIYFQQFIGLNLFLEHSIDKNLFGIEFYTSQMLAIEALFVLLLGFFIGKLWMYLENLNNKSIPDIDKFNLSFITITISFFILIIGIKMSGVNEQVSGYIYIPFSFAVAISELCLSAIGLSMVTKLAPKGFVSLYMGIWLVTIGLGGKLSGVISSYFVINKDLVSSKANMISGAEIVIVIGIISFIFCLIVRKFIIKTTSNLSA